jgi:hypothetical protein
MKTFPFPVNCTVPSSHASYLPHTAMAHYPLRNLTVLGVPGKFAIDSPFLSVFQCVRPSSSAASQ